MNQIQDDVFTQFLKSISGKNVAFFPKSGNAGDGFIAYATYTLFKKYNISFTSYSQDEIVDEEIVLIGGGGNLIEGKYEDVARIIWHHRNNKKVVLLPHTIVGYKEILAETNNNLEIFCREPVSYDLAILNGSKREKTHLAHDVTFYLEDTHFSDLVREGDGILYALRTDGESSRSFPLNNKNTDISLSWNGDLWKDPTFCMYATYSLASYINPFASVLTDRLHISILSAFLNKDVSLMPNDYFKNQAIYNHSMKKRFPTMKFINTSSNLNIDNISQNQFVNFDKAELEKKIKDLKDEIVRITEMYDNSQAHLANEMAIREELARKFQIKQDDWEEQYEILERSSSSLKNIKIDEFDNPNEEEKIQEKKYISVSSSTSIQDSACDLSVQLDNANLTINEIFNSTSWKLASKINKVSSKIPKPFRKVLRRFL